MRRLLLFALLLGAWAALGQDRNRRTLGRNQSNNSPVLLQFAPSSGTGLQSVSDLCDTYSSEMTGNYFCLRGDGTTLNGSVALSSTGSPTTQAIPQCPNGTDCSNTTGQRLNGTSQNWHTAAMASPTGSFTACWLGQFDTSTRNESFLAHEDTAANQNAIRMETLGNTGWNAYVYKNDGASTSCLGAGGLVPGAVHLLCEQYTFVADGTSNLQCYQDGVAGAGSTTAVGPVQAANSTPWEVGSRTISGSRLWTQGRILDAFVTEKALSTATMLAMYRTATTSTPTGTNGETMTFTRGSSRYCPNSGGISGTFLYTDRPCITGGGINIESAVTNIVLRNTAFDNVAWTKTNVSAITADTQTAPDGTTTAEVATSTSNGGFVESTAAALTGTAAAGSVYVKTTAGTQAVNIILRDTTAGADKCTGSLTATTTYQRLQCTQFGLTSGRNFVIRIYPGGTASTGTAVLWAGQIEAVADTVATATSPIITAGTSVARSGDSASFPTPAGLTDAVGCVGATLSALSGLSTAAPRVLDFIGSNPIYLAGMTGVNMDDGTTSAVKGGLTNFAGRTFRVTGTWGGGVIQVSGDNLFGSTSPYDGAMIGATLQVGASVGAGNDWVNSTVTSIVVGNTTTACQ